jgi:hypothetical protein
MPLITEACGYVYGQSRTSIEQINNSTGTVEYLHHDQQGSTRLLTIPLRLNDGTDSCIYGPDGLPVERISMPSCECRRRELDVLSHTWSGPVACGRISSVGCCGDRCRRGWSKWLACGSPEKPDCDPRCSFPCASCRLWVERGKDAGSVACSARERARTPHREAPTADRITYPNDKAVTRAYDKDDRLEKITDWLSHVTKFTYNPDSEQTTTLLPSETRAQARRRLSRICKSCFDDFAERFQWRSCRQADYPPPAVVVEL